MNSGDLSILRYDRIELVLLIKGPFACPHGATVAGLDPHNPVEGNAPGALESESFKDQLVSVDVEKEAGAELDHDNPEDERSCGGKSREQPGDQLEARGDIQFFCQIPCYWHEGIEKESEVERSFVGHQSNAILSFHKGMSREIQEECRARRLYRYLIHVALLFCIVNMSRESVDLRDFKSHLHMSCPCPRTKVLPMSQDPTLSEVLFSIPVGLDDT